MEPDQQTLELHSFLAVELRHEDHASSQHNHGRYLWDAKDSESFFIEDIFNLLHGGALACTWSPSDGYLIDGMLGDVSDFMMVNHVLQIDLIHLVLEVC